MLKKLLSFSLILTTFSYSFINIEPPVIGEKEGLTGEVSLGAKYSSGNTDSRSVGLSGKGEYSEKEWLVYLIASYTYGESNDDVACPNYPRVYAGGGVDRCDYSGNPGRGRGPAVFGCQQRRQAERHPDQPAHHAQPTATV